MCNEGAFKITSRASERKLTYVVGYKLVPKPGRKHEKTALQSTSNVEPRAVPLLRNTIPEDRRDGDPVFLINHMSVVACKHFCSLWDFKPLSTTLHHQKFISLFGIIK